MLESLLSQVVQALNMYSDKELTIGPSKRTDRASGDKGKTGTEQGASGYSALRWLDAGQVCPSSE